MGRLHPHGHRAILALGVCAAVAWGTAGIAATQEDDLTRLRTLDHQLASLIQQGLDQSPTLRRLAEEVQKSDLIVYVERNNRFRPGKSGSIQLVGTHGGQRYVRIGLSAGLNEREVVVLLAHELQHASELAAAPHVFDEQGMRAFYCSIGETRQFGFDTATARHVTDQVSAELATRPDR